MTKLDGTRLDLAILSALRELYNEWDKTVDDNNREIFGCDGFTSNEIRVRLADTTLSNQRIAGRLRVLERDNRVVQMLGSGSGHWAATTKQERQEQASKTKKSSPKKKKDDTIII